MKSVGMFLGAVLFFAANSLFAQSTPLRLPFQGEDNWGITCGYHGYYYGAWDDDCDAHTGTDDYALDFNLPGSDDCGEPIVAIASGEVTFAGGNPATGYGYYVDVDHGDGHVSRYAHLDSISVSDGDFVLQGQTLGTCGDTGDAFGCHLHFVLYLDDSADLPEPMSGYTGFQSCNVSDEEDTPPGCYYSDNHYPEFTDVPPFNVSGTAGTSDHAYNPDIAMLSSGEAYVVWWYSHSGTSYVYSSVCNPASDPESSETCSDPVAISETEDGGVPSVAIDSQDNIHLVYQMGSPSEIYYIKFDGEDWSSPVSISDPLSYGNNNAQIALDTSGNPRVVWWNEGTGSYSAYHIYYNEFDGEDWLGPQKLTYTFGTSGYSIRPRIAVDRDDVSHVVFERPQLENRVYYMAGSGAKESWSTPVSISDESKSANRPAIVADADGTIHAAWREQALYQRAQIMHREKAGENWQTSEAVSQNTNCDVGYPDIGVDIFGNAHLDWLQCSGGAWKVFYRRDTPDGWQSVQEITTASNPNAFSPVVIVDGAGRAHAAWMEAVPSTGAWDIFYRW